MINEGDPKLGKMASPAPKTKEQTVFMKDCTKSITSLILLAAMTLGMEASAEIEKVDSIKIGLQDNGLCKTYRMDVIPAVANHPDEPPSMNGEPKHLRVLFDKDKPSDYTDYLQRQVLLYPLKPYGGLFKGKEKAAFDGLVAQLKKIINTKSVRGIKELPILPTAEAAEVFHNQLKYISSKQVSGMAFLSAYAQDEAPLKNGDFFYTYQGLSNDGKYYVSLFWPVTVTGLPANATSKQGASYLGKLPRSAFKPSLDSIDTLIQSITLK